MSEPKYKDYSLGARLRMQIGRIVDPFASPEQIYTPQELRLILVEVFKFKQYEVSYELLKMLFFGKNKYQHVKLDELINYIIEKHIGDNAINTYSLKQGYLCKQDKLMTKTEFITTFNIGLEFIKERNVQKDDSQLNKIFQEIDRKGFGTISHEEYLNFLRDYLGSESPMAITLTTKTQNSVESMEMIASRKRSDKDELTPIKGAAGQLFQSKYFSQTSRVIEYHEPLEALKQLIIGEIRSSCSRYDSDHDQRLNRQELYQYFFNVLELERKSIDYILQNYFDFNENQSIGLPEIIEVVSEVHFRDIFSMLVKQELRVQIPSQCFMNLDIFARKLIENCFFFNKKPTIELIKVAFKEFEARSQDKHIGYISLQDFRSFVLTSLCNNRLIFRKNSKKNHTTLLNVPVSIAEVQNSHFQEDSEGAEIRPRQFESSICEAYNEQKLLACKGQSIDVNSPNSNNRVDLRYDLNSQQSKLQYKLIQNTSPLSQKNTNLDEACLQSQINQELSFSNVPRKKNSVIQRGKTNLKDQLWSSLTKIFSKYSLKNGRALSERQVVSVFDGQTYFKGSDPELQAKILKYFDMNAEIPIKLLVSYVIHKRGEDAIVNFNRSQIKGKSTLSEMEVTELLLAAYRGLGAISQQLCREYISSLKSQLRNGQMNYRSYFGLIGRVLCQPPHI